MPVVAVPDPTPLQAPPRIDFGDVAIGTTSDKALHLPHSHASPASFSAQLQAAAGPFSVYPQDGEVVPGEALALTIEFAAESLGTQAELLTVRTGIDEEGAAVAQVVVTARGAAGKARDAAVRALHGSGWQDMARLDGTMSAAATAVRRKPA